VPRTRVIAAHGIRCRNRSHGVGRRVFLWEILPPPPSWAVVPGDADRWTT
jgi:hypothetical protein